MKNKHLAIFVFLFPLFSFFLIAQPTSATNCSFHCNDLSVYHENQQAGFCHSLGGTLTTSMLTDCPTTLTCGPNNKPVCCCDTGNFTLENNQLTNNAAPIAANQTGAAATDAVIFTPSMSIPGSNFKADVPYEMTARTTGYIGEYISAYYNYAMGIVGILAVIVLMIGGVVWLTSGGNPSKVQQAKDLIIGSITGTALLLASWVLLNTVNPNLVKFKLNAIDSIQEISFIECCGGSYGIQRVGTTATTTGTGADVYLDGPFAGQVANCSQYKGKICSENQRCLGFKDKYACKDIMGTCDPSHSGVCLSCSSNLFSDNTCRPDGWAIDNAGNSTCSTATYCYWEVNTKGNSCGHGNGSECTYQSSHMGEALGILGAIVAGNANGFCPGDLQFDSGANTKDCGARQYCCYGTMGDGSW